MYVASKAVCTDYKRGTTFLFNYRPLLAFLLLVPSITANWNVHVPIYTVDHTQFIITVQI